MPNDENTSGDWGLAPSGQEFERASAQSPDARFVLRLYVSGMTARSRQAIDNIQKLCEEHLTGRYDLEIIDIYQQPDLAKEGQIIAAPTLVKKLPPPLRKVIGDMGDPGRIMVVLGIVPPADRR
ncbi:MAG: circadian clock KaiB family protein [Thermoguttaceae bacterium]|jgi:circadian clock protein KaiB